MAIRSGPTLDQDEENATGLEKKPGVKHFERICRDAGEKDLSVRELARVHGPRTFLL
jgi:hypothetical protein